ncbi:DDE-domain-containing protein [Mycena chlorophos]|uniref:DDE-domain-containing protein n=1 Tax=Mycena chlorophos TaxID=658473 RepID=A0A8H6SBR7_MYCCL|nr:DDE-domain-containing protein [Mycena chlorophos]
MPSPAINSSLTDAQSSQKSSACQCSLRHPDIQGYHCACVICTRLRRRDCTHPVYPAGGLWRRPQKLSPEAWIAEAAMLREYAMQAGVDVIEHRAQKILDDAENGRLRQQLFGKMTKKTPTAINTGQARVLTSDEHREFVAADVKRKEDEAAAKAVRAILANQKKIVAAEKKKEKEAAKIAREEAKKARDAEKAAEKERKAVEKARKAAEKAAKGGGSSRGRGRGRGRGYETDDDEDGDEDGEEDEEEDEEIEIPSESSTDAESEEASAPVPAPVPRPRPKPTLRQRRIPEDSDAAAGGGPELAGNSGRGGERGDVAASGAANVESESSAGAENSDDEDEGDGEAVDLLAQLEAAAATAAGPRFDLEENEDDGGTPISSFNGHRWFLRKHLQFHVIWGTVTAPGSRWRR